ncbi:MAG: iron ABC transporter permease [Betaproteobacteria bacterium]|nr:iron ABC transporter permease [Betaproteobacteria bacterium]
MPTRRRALLVLAVLALATAGALALALAAGSLRLSPAEVLGALAGPGGAGVPISPSSASGSELASEVVLGLRLPRALAAFACGGLLALAGALMQVLLRNPLADPYVLGVSGGAAVGALGATLLAAPLALVHGGAFGGALAAMLLVFGLAHGDGSWTQARLLLTGVVVAAGCGALVALILTLAPEERLRGMLFWLMGDVARATTPWPALLTLAVGLALALPFARELNLLARGELPARALGVDSPRLRALVYGLASLLTAVAVTTAGSIGFVGLIVPHAIRLLVGNDQRLLLPAAALGGGALLVVADTAARTLVAPQQLPVGVLTALLGVPLFLILLARQPRGVLS